VHIQQHLDEGLSLETLADLAHFSPYHFHRVFTGMVGESLHSHIRRIRLERAAQRLLHTDSTVTRIGLEAGFETAAAFTRAFRALTSLAPTEYRRRRRAAPALASLVHFDPSGDAPDFRPLDTGGSAMKAKIETMPPRRVAFVRHVGPYSACGKAWDTLLTRLGSEGWVGAGAHFVGICHDDPEITPPERVRYDACVTVPESFQPDGEIGVQVIGGGDYAVTTHRGPYDRLGRTYSLLMGQWIPRHGRRLRAGPCLERYLNSPESTEPEELLTDVCVPLVDADAIEP
jgi:AraC family transcriptional regulator